jgi:hypothetical protein
MSSWEHPSFVSKRFRWIKWNHFIGSFVIPMIISRIWCCCFLIETLVKQSDNQTIRQSDNQNFHHQLPSSKHRLVNRNRRISFSLSMRYGFKSLEDWEIRDDKLLKNSSMITSSTFRNLTLFRCSIEGLWNRFIEDDDVWTDLHDDF